MRFKRPRSFAGCFVVAIAVAVGLLAVQIGSESWEWYRLTSTENQLAMLNDEVQGFRCENLTVTRRVRPAHSNYGWGAMLAMPADCRADLRQRAERSDRLDANGENCFQRFGRFRDRQLCFEGKEVYFGAYRLS